MKKFKEFIKEKSDSIICFSAFMGMVVILVWLNNTNQCISDIDMPTTVETTTVETTTAAVEENTTVNVEAPASTEPTGQVSISNVGFSEVIEEMPTDFEIGICAWADIVLDKSELDLLRTTVYCEAGDQTLETQYMVALTILNRLNVGYASDLRGVIYQKGAFAVTKWSNFEQRGWTEQVEQAVEMALQTNEHPRNMYYFRDSYYHSFANNYKCSGSMYFSTQKEN